MNRKKAMLLMMLSFMICVACLATFLKPTDSIKLNTERSSELGDKWVRIVDGRETAEISIPAELDIPAGETLRIRHTLPQKISDVISIGIQTIHQSITVWVGDEMLYSHGTDPSRFLGNSTGELWHLADIPQRYEGQTITIELKAFYPQYAGTVRTVKLGSRSAIISSIIYENMFSLIIALIAFIIGAMLVMLQVAFYRWNVGYSQVLYLGIFSLIAAFWILSASPLPQIFIKGQFWISWGKYLLIMLMPLPLLVFIDGSYTSSLPKCINLQFATYVICFGVVNVLHFTKTASFSQTAPAVHILMIASVILMSTNMIVETVKYKNKGAQRTFFVLAVFMLTSVFEIVNSYTHWFESMIVADMGVLLFVVFFGIESAGRFREAQTEGLRSHYYRELAYRDSLTCGLNRMAYIAKLEEYDGGTAPDGIRLLLFDLNNLKIINDTYGHRRGDDALIKCFKCITDVFGGDGECYRIGGDEFACILSPCSTEKFQDMVKRFREKTQYESKRTEYFFGVAMGHAMYSASDTFNMDQLSEEADRLLYADKKMMKAKMSV